MPEGRASSGEPYELLSEYLTHHAVYNKEYRSVITAYRLRS